MPSGWGYGTWGSTLKWGLTGEIDSILTQSPATLALIDVTITIGGVDVSAYVESYRVTLRGTGEGSDAEATLLAGHGATLTSGSTFLVEVTYTDSSGGTATFTRFSGWVRAASTTGSVEGTRETVTAGNVLITLSNTARQVSSRALYNVYQIYRELAASGMTGTGTNIVSVPLSVSVSGTTYEVDLAAYATSLDLIVGMANMGGPAYLYADGTNVKALGYKSGLTATISVTAAMQVDHKSEEVSDNRLNQVLVIMDRPDSTVGINDGTFYGSYVTGGFRVNNPADIAKWGTRQIEIRPTFKPEYTSRGFELGRWTLAQSEAATYRWKTILNATIYPTVVATLTLPSGSTRDVLIEEVTDSGGPGSHWSSVSARATYP